MNIRLGRKRNRVPLCLITSFLWLILSFAYSPIEVKAVSNKDEPEVIERTIRIEGRLEKPRVIFIVPRSKLWKEDISKKSFIQDILKPVYPESLIKEPEGKD